VVVGRAGRVRLEKYNNIIIDPIFHRSGLCVCVVCRDETKQHLGGRGLPVLQGKFLSGVIVWVNKTTLLNRNLVRLWFFPRICL